MADFKSATAESGLMVLDCMATWCGPCKVIAPVVRLVLLHFLPTNPPTPSKLPIPSLIPTIHTNADSGIVTQVVKMSNNYPNARFYKLDVDEVPDVAHELGVRAMPTFIVFKDGEKVGEVVGANAKALEALVAREVTALKA